MVFRRKNRSCVGYNLHWSVVAEAAGLGEGELLLGRRVVEIMIGQVKPEGVA